MPSSSAARSMKSPPPEEGAQPRSLGDLSVGESAIVRHVGCARATAVRLMEMGLLPGTRVTLLRVAPLGDPLELVIGGYALSIRRAEARSVMIEATTEVATATESERTVERVEAT